VRKGIDRLKKRHGDIDEDESSSEEETRGKGKAKAREQVIEEIDALAGQNAFPSAIPGPAKGSKRSTKKADWNPNLQSTQPDASSSDFDSSDSENDSEPKAGPSVVKAKSKSKSPPPAVAEPPVVAKRPAVASALKAGPTVAGGALKKSANGTAVAPRIEIRRKQRIVSGRYTGWDTTNDVARSQSGIRGVRRIRRRGEPRR
jgi:ATP-dependent RNA helicase DHX37/DHR1